MLVQEFHPYVFQIFAQLIELRPAPLPETYMAIFRPLLAPVFWERPGNIPALTRLLQAYCRKAMKEIKQQGLLEVNALCLSHHWTSEPQRHTRALLSHEEIKRLGTTLSRFPLCPVFLVLGDLHFFKLPLV